jgi:hypothetical protein
VLWAWGWAVDRNAAGSNTGVDRVTVYLDGPPATGTLLGTAKYGLSRPDVGSYFGNARWNNSGWEFIWTPRSLSVGPHTLYVDMHSSVTGASSGVTQRAVFTPPPAGGVPASARPPASYVVPTGAVSVSDSAGLLSALAATTPQDIVLASGVYDNAIPFQNTNGHRLYAATLGGAVLRAGLVVGGNWGPGGALVQGLTFDVSDPAKTALNSIVHVWGDGGRGSRILDSTFNGHGLIGSAVMARQPDGLVVQRVRVRDFTDNGVLADANVPNLALSVPVLLEDLDVAGVAHATPGAHNGRAEACVWLGNTGTLRRALIRNCAWMGVWTGSADRGSIHEDLDIDGAPTGVYMEHFTTASTFQRMRIGSNVWTGVFCEWADPLWGSKPACSDNVIQDSTIASASVGVYLDQGTTRTTVRRVKFIGTAAAAIKDHLGIDNAFYDNDYFGIAAGSVPVAP